MADIDDELLALAGSDEDDSGDESRGRSYSPEPSRRRDSPRGSGRKDTNGRGRRGDSDDEDDGEQDEREASSAPSSPSSLKSAPMDESDSDAEPSRADVAGDDTEEKYPIEGLYVSLAEKEQILRMREVERETILAERREESQRFKQNRMLRQLVTETEEKEKEQQRRKRSADDADLADDQERKASRQRTRTDGTTSSGLDTLRRARAEKSDRLRRREEDRDRDRQRGGISPRKSLRDRDDEYDYEPEGVDDDRHRHRSPEYEARPVEPKLVDFERLRISRNNFAEVCFKPGFDEALTDCYVRILGKPQNGRQSYHMVAIKGFVEGKAYAMTDHRGKKFVTDQHVLAGIGSRTEQYPFIAMSTGQFTEEELEGYKKALADRGLSLPKVSALDKKLSQLQALVSYKLTNSEITAMVERKNTLRRRHDPDFRERMVRELEEARASGNTILAGQIQEDLDSLGKAAGLAFRTSLRPDKTATPSPGTSQQDRLAQLNADIRRRNIEDIRRAQVQDRQRMQAREKEHRLARGESVQDGKPRGKGKLPDENTPGGSRVGSGTNTPGNGAGAGAAKKDQVLPEIAKLKEQRYAQSTGIPTVHKPLMDDDVIGSLDIGIDVDIE